MKSPDISALGHDNGPLTDGKIKAYILLGTYGTDRLRTELINGSAALHAEALRGKFGPLASHIAEEVRGTRHLLAARKTRRTHDYQRTGLARVKG